MQSPHVPTPDVRVSTLIGDRACITCGYNLVGQPVIREPHYNLLIVRCPECGGVAPTQEYPLLGRWAGRFAAVLSAIWFFFVVAFLFGTAGTQLGMALGMANAAADPYSEAIWRVYDEWSSSSGINLSGFATLPPMAQMSMGAMFSPDFDKWWTALPIDARQHIYQSVGGWRSIINPWTIVQIVPTVLIAFVFGAVWAVVMIGRRGSGLILFSLVPFALLLALSVFPYVAMQSEFVNSPGDAAIAELGMPVYIVAVIVQWLVMVSGMLVGRPIVRWLMTILLVPRLLVPLSILWSADDRPLPRARKL